MPTLILPASLRRRMARPADLFHSDAGTVEAALAQLTAAHPDLTPALFGDDGRLCAVVRLYRGETPVRSLSEPLAAGDELIFLLPIAGG